MPISVAFEAPDFITLRASGVLERAAVDAVKRQLHDHMREHGRAHVLVVLAEDFADLEALASWDDIPEDAFIQQQVIRLAVVGDLRWHDRAVLFFLNAVGRFQIHYFRPEHETLARAWLTA